MRRALSFFFILGLVACQSPQPQAPPAIAQPSPSAVGSTPSPIPVTVAPTAPAPSFTIYPEALSLYLDGEVTGTIKTQSGDNPYTKGVMLQLKSLRHDVPYEQDITSVDGSFKFVNVPMLPNPTNFELTISAPNYQTIRIRVPLNRGRVIADCCPVAARNSGDSIGPQGFGTLATITDSIESAAVELDLKNLDKVPPLTPLQGEERVTSKEVTLEAREVSFNAVGACRMKFFTCPRVFDYGDGHVRGLVKNEEGYVIEGVELIARSLSSERPYEATVQSFEGMYVFNSIPTGITMEITAKKTGYATRRATIVPLRGVPNDLNFVNTGDAAMQLALSDRPEVISTSPSFGTVGVKLNPSFQIKWSEPVNQDDVEAAFQIIVSKAALFPFSNAGELWPLKHEVLNSTHFRTIWSMGGTEASFVPLKEVTLISDQYVDRIPTYAMTFKEGVTIRDRVHNRSRPTVLTVTDDGLDDSIPSLSTGIFRLGGTSYKNFVPFSVKPN